MEVNTHQMQEEILTEIKFFGNSPQYMMKYDYIHVSISLTKIPLFSQVCLVTSPSQIHVLSMIF